MTDAGTELRPAGAILLWLVLVLVCAGLGYPTLRRYDPRDPRMNYDGTNALYHWQVTRDAHEANYGPSLVHFRYRVLVPLVARPFYLLARNNVGTWDPGYFGLLIANSLFSATTALLLFLIARDVTRDAAPALVAALLYVLSFAVPNFHLAGLIDSGEAFALTAVAWCLHRGRWWLLPLAGIAGALAKETFVAFSAVFAAGWMAAEWLEDRGTNRSGPIGYRGGMIALMALAGMVTLTTVFSVANGRLVLPWQLATSGSVTSAGPLGRAARLASDVGVLYFFGWLAPLGAASVMRCPRPWVAGALLSAATAVALGIYNGEPGIARSLFDILGPLLSVASAISMLRLLGWDRK